MKLDEIKDKFDGRASYQAKCENCEKVHTVRT